MTAGTTIFVDCGNTLVEPRIRFEDELFDAAQGWIEFGPMYNGDKGSAIRTRASATPFLEALTGEGHELRVLSGGDRPSQLAYLDAARLLRFLREVHGDGDRVVRPSGPWLLVDDDEEPTSKLKKLGFDKARMQATEWQAVLDKHVVRCPSCWGGSDEPLTDLLPVIQQKLAAQGWVAAA